MCNVCVADEALEVTRCKSDRCVAYRRGHEIRWEDAPKIKITKLKRNRSKLQNRVAMYLSPSVFIRARGKDAEFQKAEYQLRRWSESWPKIWMKSDDLAGTLGMYGFDVKWKYIDKDVQAWILGKRKMPTEAELRSKITRTFTCSKCGDKIKVVGGGHPQGWDILRKARSIKQSSKRYAVKLVDFLPLCPKCK